MFEFIQNQIFKMEFLNDIIGWILLKFGLNEGSKIFGGIQFFIYDTLKIFIFLGILIFLISYIQSYFPPEKTKKILSKFKGISANILAALLGTVTPFCSCSSIPIFIGFTKAKIPVGVSFSFLISSPLVDLASLVLLTGIFGIEIALMYVLVGIILAVIGGVLIEKLGLSKYIETYEVNENSQSFQIKNMTQKFRIGYAKSQVKSTVKKVWIYIIIGVLIGSLIHNFIPQEFITNILGEDNIFSVIIATLISIPMYADIFSVIPIGEALYLKGASIGVILSFIMGVTALSLPSIIMLKNVMKSKLLIFFVGFITLGIIFIGYLFNTIVL